MYGSIVRPETSDHAWIRSCSDWIGVRDPAPSSMDIVRRRKLSTTATSCPAADRCIAVGQPR